MDPRNPPGTSRDVMRMATMAAMAGNPGPRLPPGQVIGSQARRHSRVGRNDPCPCGSGVKFKKCCLSKTKPRTHHRPANLRPRERPYVAGATISEVTAATEAAAAPAGRQQTAQAMLRVGVDENIVWAYLETGIYVTEANRATQPPAVLERWDAALAAYDDATDEERQILAVTPMEQQPGSMSAAYNITVPTVLTHPNGQVPVRGSDGAAGHDICCVGGCTNLYDGDWDDETLAGWDLLGANGMITIKPGDSFLFRTGIKQAIPEGYVGLLWDRGGLGAIKQVHRLAGVIDDDYRGEWFVRLVNHSHKPVVVKVGAKIVQVVYQKYAIADCPIVDNFDHVTHRDVGAFGSTDKPLVTMDDFVAARMPMIARYCSMDSLYATRHILAIQHDIASDEFVYTGMHATDANNVLNSRTVDRQAALRFMLRDREFFVADLAIPIDVDSLRPIPGIQAVAFKMLGFPEE